MKGENPPIDPRLVEWLERVFPDKCPDPKDSDREIWMDVGRALLIRMLRTKLNVQEENILES